MSDNVYVLETMIRERNARLRQQIPLQAALYELERSRVPNGERLVTRLRRAVSSLLPIRRAQRTATR